MAGSHGLEKTDRLKRILETLRSAQVRRISWVRRAAGSGTD